MGLDSEQRLFFAKRCEKMRKEAKMMRKEAVVSIKVVYGGLDSVVDNALACHHCDPGSNPGQGMWQGSGRPSRFGGFPLVLRFPLPRWTT